MHDHALILHFFVPSYRSGQKKDVSNSLIIVISISSIFILLFLSSFHKTMAISPSFELQELINKNHYWVQTYRNSDAHLKSNYTDIRSIDYISNGKSLNATFWLASGFKNSSVSTYKVSHLQIYA
jgi:fucose 4-O-acetylase-like acetyltransferase